MKLDAIVNQPVIETERFVLRPLRRSDQGLIEFYASQADVARIRCRPARRKPLSRVRRRRTGSRMSGRWTGQPRASPRSWG
jgi:hypothetical protein